jgi:hypothetical protein
MRRDYPRTLFSNTGRCSRLASRAHRSVSGLPGRERIGTWARGLRIATTCHCAYSCRRSDRVVQGALFLRCCRCSRPSMAQGRLSSVLSALADQVDWTPAFQPKVGPRGGQIGVLTRLIKKGDADTGSASPFFRRPWCLGCKRRDGDVMARSRPPLRRSASHFHEHTN